MKRFKKALALVVVCAMMLVPMNAFAQADLAVAGDKTLTGTSTAVNPVYKVSLPSSIVVTVDSFALGNKGQVYSNNFAVVNRSNIPVQVKGAFWVSNVGTDVDYITEGTPSKEAGKKDISVNIKLATGIVDNATNSASKLDNTVTTPVWSFGAEADGSEDVEFVVQDGTGTSFTPDAANDIYWVLDAANYNGTALASGGVTAVNNGGGFVFTGAATTNPVSSATDKVTAWKANDVIVSAKFSLVGLAPFEIDGYLGAAVADQSATDTAQLAKLQEYAIDDEGLNLAVFENDTLNAYKAS